MNRWKGTPPPSSLQSVRAPVPPPVIAPPEPIAPPVQARPPAPSVRPGTGFAVSLLRTVLVATLLVTATLGGKILWDRSQQRETAHTVAWPFHSPIATQPLTSATRPASRPLRTVDRGAKRHVALQRPTSAVDLQPTGLVSVSRTVLPPQAVAERRVAKRLLPNRHLPVKPVLERTALKPAAPESMAPESMVPEPMVPQRSLSERPDLLEPTALRSPAPAAPALAVAQPAAPDFPPLISDQPVTCVQPADPDPAGVDPSAECQTCAPTRTLGTAIAWADDADQAAQLARQQEKLVFLIQVSGNFAREGFT